MSTYVCVYICILYIYEYMYKYMYNTYILHTEYMKRQTGDIYGNGAHAYTYSRYTAHIHAHAYMQLIRQTAAAYGNGAHVCTYYRYMAHILTYV